MNSTRLLYQAAGQPPVPAVIDASGWMQLSKRKRPTAPPGGKCYLCGGEVEGVGVPTAERFGETWTAHGDALQPDDDTCNALLNACAMRDLVVINAGTEKNIIRILSPLVISDELLNKGLDIMEEELDKICA